jgi:hypothetical protein
VRRLTPSSSAVVRRRGIHDGSDGGSSSAEIDVLTSSIKGDVTRVHATLDALQAFVDSRKADASRAGATPGVPLPLPPQQTQRGVGAASVEAGADVTSSVQGLAHSDAVLAGLKSTLVGFGASLKAVVTLRADSLKAASSRRAHFGSGAARDLGRPLAMGGGAVAIDVQVDAAGSGAGARGAGTGAATATARRAAAYGGAAAPSLGVDVSSPQARRGAAFGGGASSPPPPLAHSSSAAFALVDQAQLAAEPGTAYLEARASDMAAIESSITELSGLFSRLAGLVAEQGAAVERIDSAADEAAVRMEAGTGELQRHLDRVSSSRGLALKVAGVLVMAAVGFTMLI